MSKLTLTLIISALLITCFSRLHGQNYLSRERENEIKLSERYYWGECSDFKEVEAKQCALADLNNQIIKNAVNQLIRVDEILKAIEMSVHFEQLQQQGKLKFLAWIEKDSVFVTTKKPITQMAESKSATQNIIKPGLPPASSPAVHRDESKTVETDNTVLQKLAACKTYTEVKRVAIMNGLVRGSAINSPKGFTNPERCIIAVFTLDGTLSALLDTGGSSRTDLISGKTIQNPEQYYSREEYYLWYMQQKNN